MQLHELTGSAVPHPWASLTNSRSNVNRRITELGAFILFIVERRIFGLSQLKRFFSLWLNRLLRSWIYLLPASLLVVVARSARHRRSSSYLAWMFV